MFNNNNNSKDNMKKTYDIISYGNLKKMNRDAQWKKKNQYIPEDIMQAIKGKFVIVSHQFPHNDVEQRLVLFAGEKFPNLLLDVDFKDLKNITPIKFGAVTN
jgi:hypothetical protein